MLSKLGEADSATILFDPIIDEDSTIVYHYKKSRFVAESGEIKEIAIKDSTYLLTYKEIKIGSSLSSIKNIFPKSYYHISSGEDSSRKVLTIYIGDLEKNVAYDQEVQLLFVDGLLERIAIWEPL